jgi:hypothetical protein
VQRVSEHALPLCRTCIVPAVLSIEGIRRKTIICPECEEELTLNEIVPLRFRAVTPNE